jgi:hypothetical protein
VNINSTTEILGTDLAGPVSGPVAFSDKLGQSGQARDCMTTQWFEFVFSRQPVEEDVCGLKKIQESFRANDNMQSMVLALGSGDNILYVRQIP